MTLSNTISEIRKKVCILGGTGFIGRHLQKRLLVNGYVVEVFGRKAFASQSSLIQAIDQSDILIVLVGENIGQRWSEKYKQALYDSRIQRNQQIAEALKLCEQPPKKILNASAIGVYPENDCHNPVDESCTEVGDNFLGELGHAWEVSSLELNPKPVIMRFGVVLGRDGGALQKMLPAFKLGLGGPVAGGQQCFSWVHIDDLTNAIFFLIDCADGGEVYNLCSPQPLSNEAFGTELAKILKRPFWLPLPEWQLRLMFGEGAQVLTHSSAVLPNHILHKGFNFEFVNAADALEDLLG